MANGLCKDTNDLISAEITKIRNSVGNSTISNFDDYKRITNFWKVEDVFVKKMSNKKKQLKKLKAELINLLEVVKSFPKEEININTVTDLQKKSFPAARPFSDDSTNETIFNEIASSIQSIILDAESLEFLVNDRLNLCTQIIGDIDQLNVIILGANESIKSALKPAKTEYNNYLVSMKKIVGAGYSIEFWTWFRDIYVKQRGPVKVNYTYYFSIDNPRINISN